MATSQFLFDEMAANIVFADHAGDFSPAAASSREFGTPTDVQLSLASVGDTAARQSAKVNLGATWAPAYAFSASLEFGATPTSSEVVDFYWCPSSSPTAANGNAGGVSGSDAAYTGQSSNLAVSLKQLVYIGAFITSALATGNVQQAEIGLLVPTQRYGSLVVVNESGVAFHSDDVECHVVAVPLVVQGQAT